MIEDITLVAHLRDDPAGKSYQSLFPLSSGAGIKKENPPLKLNGGLPQLTRIGNIINPITARVYFPEETISISTIIMNTNKLNRKKSL